MDWGQVLKRYVTLNILSGQLFRPWGLTQERRFDKARSSEAFPKGRELTASVTGFLGS
jgi:hypothetical protein